MKIIAHRSAFKTGAESSVEAMIVAARAGVDLVECDVTRLGDGVDVIFHDASLARLTGEDIYVKNLSFDEFERRLLAHKIKIITLQTLLENYREQKPVLLHIKMKTIDEEFVKNLKDSGVPFVFGATSISVASTLSEHFEREKILAFMPKPTDFKEFYSAGAGIIRLWENWLGDVTPAMVKEYCSDAEVWVMANSASDGMAGNLETLNKCRSLGADGILLDNFRLALEWKKSQI